MEKREPPDCLQATRLGLITPNLLLISLSEFVLEATASYEIFLENNFTVGITCISNRLCRLAGSLFLPVHEYGK